MKRLRCPRDMFLLILSVLFYWIGLYLYVPTLPTFIQTRTGTLAGVGIVLSMYGLLMGVLRLPVGVASDLVGRRKPFIILGLVLVGLGAWIMGVSSTARGLLLGRALTGVAATAWVPFVVLFSGMFRLEEAVRVAALLTFILNIGRILATSLTGWLNRMGGYSLAFYVAAGSAAIAILLILPVRETACDGARRSGASVVRLIRRPDVLLPAALSAVNLYADYTVTFSFMPILAGELGVSDVTKSLLVSLNLVAVAVGSLLVVTLARRIETRFLVWGSVVLLSIGIGMVAVADNVSLLIASQFIFGLAAGSGYSVFMGLSIRFVAQSDRATAMGLHQAVYASGMFAGPWISGLLGDAIGIRPMFAVTAVLCFILSAALIIAIRRRSMHRIGWNQSERGPAEGSEDGSRSER